MKDWIQEEMECICCALKSFWRKKAWQKREKLIDSSPVVNGCKEKALYTPVPCTRFLLNIEPRNWAPMSHIIHLTNKAMRQEGIKPGILLSWCNDKVRAARSYRSQTADEGCCSPLEIGIARKLPRNGCHVVSGYQIRIPIFRCYKSIKQRKSLDVKHKK